MERKTQVLIVEDEEDIIELIEFNLKKNGFKVSSVSEGEKACDAVKLFMPDLILLDIMLPGKDGLEICKELKTNPDLKHIPIIMITAKSEDEDIVKGLELGAEDYMPKPFSPKVLIARINSVLKRVSAVSTYSEQMEMGGLKIDLGKRGVFVNNEAIDLTYSEFEALSMMAKKPGWVFTRYQLIEAIHGEDHYVTDRAVDVMIVNLRKKLGVFSEKIETIRGVGYRFKESI